MRIEMFLPSVPNTTITLFNNEQDEAEVLARHANGSKRDTLAMHCDIAQDRVNDDLYHHMRDNKQGGEFRRVRLVRKG